jgi:hypothetical protein
MGEDTCLFEEEDGSEQSQAGDEAGHDEPEVRHNVDVLVEKFVDTLESEDDDAVQRKCVSETKPVTLFLTMGIVNMRMPGAKRFSTQSMALCRPNSL